MVKTKYPKRVAWLALFAIAIGALLFFLTGCYGAKSSASQKGSQPGQSTPVLAWNEDTLNSYAIGFIGNRFSYTIRAKENDRREEQYKGTYMLRNDTLLLAYRNGSSAGLTDFLVIDPSRAYLIQPLSDSVTRIFLRVQSKTHLF